MVSPLLHIVQKAAGQKFLPLAFGGVQKRHDCASCHPERDLRRPRLDQTPQPRYLEMVALLETVVVRRILEGQWQDAEIDQVRAVDSRETLGDLDPDAEVTRCQRRMLAG